jgi:RNA recognition motif-containing protein
MKACQAAHGVQDLISRPPAEKVLRVWRRNFAMLLFSNLPHNCSESELRKSIEARGVPLSSVRVVRDSSAGQSPAFGDVEIQRGASEAHALVCLAGMEIRSRAVRVREVTVYPRIESVKREIGSVA